MQDVHFYSDEADSLGYPRATRLQAISARRFLLACDRHSCQSLIELKLQQLLYMNDFCPQLQRENHTESQIEYLYRPWQSYNIHFESSESALLIHCAH